MGKQICLTIVWGCAEILPLFVFKSNLIGRDFVDITALSLGRDYTFPQPFWIVDGDKAGDTFDDIAF